MTDGVSESRFYMWRAIFAVAHADGRLDADEEAFMDSYLKSVPFTLRQKAILEDDIIHPKDAGAMLSRVVASEDQGMFFEFARMMCWSDGNYDAQEKEIMQRLLGAHMEKLDVEGLTRAMHASREKAQAMKREQDEYLKEQAQKKVGIGAIIARLFASDKDTRLPGKGVSESRFYMWRAIFAMAHADGAVSGDERNFMLDALRRENFSAAQRQLLERAIEEPENIMEMFMSIAEQEDRSRFFYFARLMCWSDGNFDAQEQKIMLTLKSIHVRNIDFEQVLQKVDMTLDDESRRMLTEDARSKNPFGNFLRRFK